MDYKLLIVDQLRRLSFDSLADRLARCGTVGLFYKCPDHHTWASSTVSCSRSICPVCAAKKSVSWSNAIANFCEAHPTLRAFGLTLTIPSSPSLAAALDTLRVAFRQLRHYGELKRSMGGVYTIEITWGSAGWHPHLHVVVLCAPGTFLDIVSIRDQWSKNTGGRQCHISRLKTISDIREFTKYSMKLSTVPDSHLEELITTTTGSKLRCTFGEIRISVAEWNHAITPTDSSICPVCGQHAVSYSTFSTWDGPATVSTAVWETIAHAKKPIQGLA